MSKAGKITSLSLLGFAYFVGGQKWALKFLIGFWIVKILFLIGVIIYISMS